MKRSLAFTGIGLFTTLVAIMVFVATTHGGATKRLGGVTDYYLVYTDNIVNNGANIFISGFESTMVQGSDVIDDLGIHVTAGDDVFVYLLNPGEASVSVDALTALPVESLGTEYIVMAWPDTGADRDPNGYGLSELAIVSPFDNTMRDIDG